MNIRKLVKPSEPVEPVKAATAKVEAPSEPTAPAPSGMVTLTVPVLSDDVTAGPNCLLAICCPPRSQKQKTALAQEMCRRLKWPDAKYAEALSIADWIAETFDLAPLGTLVELKAVIAKLARENT